MGSLLSGYLSNKGKPIICNGQLLRSGNKMVYARESANYSVIFTTASKSNVSAQYTEVNLTTGEGVKVKEGEQFTPLNEHAVISAVLDFDRTYAPMFYQAPENVDASCLSIDIDPFTQALIIESDLYQRMTDPVEFHRIDRQYDEVGQKIRAKMLLDYIESYYVLYSYLFNSKLTGTRAPAITKGHMVAGLFQPLQCYTNRIRSPLEYPIFSGFRSIINGQALGLNDDLGDIEEELEPREGIDRGLYLTCVSMYDIVHRLSPSGIRPENVYVPRGLDRRMFMYILLTVLSRQVAKGLDVDIPILSRHQARLTELRDSEAYLTLFERMQKGYEEKCSQIVTA